MKSDPEYRNAHAVRVATNNVVSIPAFLEMHPLEKRLLLASLQLESEELNSNKPTTKAR